MNKKNPPALSDEQRKVAVERAYRNQKKRREVRAELEAGNITIQDVLEMDDPAIKKMRVSSLLMSAFDIREKRVARIMDELDISQKRRVGGLGCRQKEAILSLESPLGTSRRKEESCD